MHEFSLVLSLIQRVQQEVDARNAKAVHRVQIKVGELSGVEPDLLRSAFEIAREGSACAAADLGVELVPAEWTCRGCGQRIARGEALQCARCGQPARLTAGGDITFESMELEIDDV